MQEVQQRYIEYPDNPYQSLVRENIQSFTISSAQLLPRIIVMIIVIISLSLTISAGIYFRLAPIVLFAFIVALAIFMVLSVFVVSSRFKNTKTIELHDDKLVIIGKDKTTINISDLRAYGINYGNGFASLTLKLNNGKKIKLSTAYGKGLREFTYVFDSRMQQLIREKHLPIKKLTNWWNIFTLALLAIVLLISLLKGLQVI